MRQCAMRKITVVLLFAVSVFAQQTPQADSPIFVTAIDVIADVRDNAGKVPEGLSAGDFVLLEDGVERKIIGVELMRTERTAPAQPAAAAATSAPASAAPAAAVPPRRLWQTVIYFENLLSNGQGRRRSASELAQHVDKLVAMGTVDVVYADPQPTVLVRGSRDGAAVRAALEKISASTGFNQLALHRRDFHNTVQSASGLDALKKNSPPPVIRTIGQPDAPQPSFDRPVGRMGPPVAVDPNTVRPYIEQEIQYIKRMQSTVLSWLGNYRRHSPRALLLVTDGFDLDPFEFYQTNLTKQNAVALRAEMTHANLADINSRFAQSLSAAGWTSIIMPSENQMDGWVDDASTQSLGRMKRTVSDPATQTPRAFVLRPLGPLGVIADETGGTVVPNSSRIAEAVNAIDDRVRITYQVPRKPDGKARKVELRPRDRALKVRSSRWAASATPVEMAEQRALGLLKGSAYTGDLPVDAKIEWISKPGRKAGNLTLAARGDAVKAALPAGSRADYRLTLAIQVPPNQAFVTTKELPPQDLANPLFTLRTPLDFPGGTSVVVLTLEDVATGMWGSARVEVP